MVTWSALVQGFNRMAKRRDFHVRDYVTLEDWLLGYDLSSIKGLSSKSLYVHIYIFMVFLGALVQCNKISSIPDMNIF